MSEFKGTKGTAKLMSDCFENKYNFYTQSISTSGSSIILFANAYGKTKEETKANAKLISYALKMLEMLELLTTVYSADNIDKAKQLITKATKI